MDYFSTRGAGPINLDDALKRGIANDGGLYLPKNLPKFNISDFDGADSIIDTANILLKPFFLGSSLELEMKDILRETFHFPIPTNNLSIPEKNASVLELYHGPTAAFKDIGASFLAACLTRLEGKIESPLTILVATSGDTGGAVAAAFDSRPGMRVVVLFPDGRVSARQEHQLCCWSENVLSLRVKGSFDDCQSLVKAAMADKELSITHRFSSANSINIGRLLPQSTYYADSSLQHFHRTGKKPGFIIPTGNLGNALACIIAREMGLPIGPIILSTNANKTIPNYLKSLKWAPSESLQTLATAMDVGNPSNMERLRHLVGDAKVLRNKIGVSSVEDNEIEEAIKKDHETFGFTTCPHTATATHVWRNLDTALQKHHWIIVATAHPAKFETIVEPLIEEKIPMPPDLANILSKTTSAVDIEPTLGGLSDALKG
ncbi:MAG: threonine synthase [Gammaproteobacteria bacterium]|nr:threonine synthase [Gammaproteobacteria bacterium]|tara:strand:+ start:984 stop:2279 length:1296 start_codon:yes stop_codon:yes gene_type:complete